MKKIAKFIFGTLAVTSLVAGAYYLYKNILKKDSAKDFDDFEDEFDESEVDTAEESREYVPINISPEVSTVEEADEISPETEEEADNQ